MSVPQEIKSKRWLYRGSTNVPKQDLVYAIADAASFDGGWTIRVIDGAFEIGTVNAGMNPFSPGNYLTNSIHYGGQGFILINGDTPMGFTPPSGFTIINIPEFPSVSQLHSYVVQYVIEVVKIATSGIASSVNNFTSAGGGQTSWIKFGRNTLDPDTMHRIYNDLPDVAIGANLLSLKSGIKGGGYILTNQDWTDSAGLNKIDLYITVGNQPYDSLSVFPEIIVAPSGTIPSLPHPYLGISDYESSGKHIFGGHVGSFSLYLTPLSFWFVQETRFAGLEPHVFLDVLFPFTPDYTSAAILFASLGKSNWRYNARANGGNWTMMNRVQNTFGFNAIVPYTGTYATFDYPKLWKSSLDAIQCTELYPIYKRDDSLQRLTPGYMYGKLVSGSPYSTPDESFNFSDRQWAAFSRGTSNTILHAWDTEIVWP